MENSDIKALSLSLFLEIKAQGEKVPWERGFNLLQGLRGPLDRD